MIEGRDAAVDRQAIEVRHFLEARGYHLYLHRKDRLIPRRAEDVQEGSVADYFASKRPYEEGARIGRHLVGPLPYEESIAWVAENAAFPLNWHRMHAAGVIARWIREGRDPAPLAELARRLNEDDDLSVASFARDVLSRVP